MTNTTHLPEFLGYFPLFAAGIFAGLTLAWLTYRLRRGTFEHLGREIIQRAEIEAENFRQKKDLELKEKEIEHQNSLSAASKREEERLRRETERIEQREDKLEERMGLVQTKLSDMERREAVLQKRRDKLLAEESDLKHRAQELKDRLHALSQVSPEEAKTLVLNDVRQSVSWDAARISQDILREAKERSTQKAQNIIATAIGRLAVACATEATCSTIALPSDDMKGRMIGREGRNIRALEQATGVTLVVDDTPSAISVSGMDPVRLEVAKKAIEGLLADGRVHPTRIEEVVKEAKQAVFDELIEHGKNAADRAQVYNLAPELIELLGKLRYRRSYGQNVLDHSVEVAHLLGLMTAELGLDQTLGRRIGLLHDIGKAAGHEKGSSHALVGGELAKKYGECEKVCNGIACHHNEVQPICVEASLCGPADALSGSRPGARIEAVESYIQRIQKLEAIAGEFPGVQKAYALQAGRELRISVLPDMIDDAGALNLARDVAKKIEECLDYPGRIKVLVLREKRAVEYAV